MDPATSGRGARRDQLDERSELLGCLDGRGAPSFDDRAGDPRGLGLLAVAPEESRQLGRVEGREELGGGNPAARVEAHVEWPAGPNAESALRVRELEARQPEIEQQAVDGPEAGRRSDRAELAEVRLAEDQPVPEPLEEAADSGDGRPIGV
jgi:hypothetical protein